MSCLCLFLNEINIIQKNKMLLVGIRAYISNIAETKFQLKYGVNTIKYF
jgi:hypothetical protein